ncbi:MAG: hypothetical protein LUG66_04780 [Clostridiales bacterium]|nr:hypothetical protein [Clostridiales bacterium]
MYKGIKRNALKKLFSNRSTAIRFFSTYFIETAAFIVCFHFINNSFWQSLTYIALIYMICLGEFTVFLKLADGKEITDDDFMKCLNDKEYIQLFKTAGKRNCLVIIPFTIAVIFFKMILVEIFTVINYTHIIFFGTISFISAVFLVLLLAKYLFTSFILTDIHNKTLTFDREAKGDIYALNERLTYGKYFDRIKFVLSFSGWFLLSLITFGLGFAFLVPYFLQSAAELYITENKERSAQ